MFLLTKVSSFTTFPSHSTCTVSRTHFRYMPHVWWFILKLIKRKIWPRDRAAERNKRNEWVENERRLNLLGYRELSFPQWWFFFLCFSFPALDYRIRVLGSLILFYYGMSAKDLVNFNYESPMRRVSTVFLFKVFLISRPPRWDLFLYINSRAMIK